jgi:hypothetical protein
MPQTWRTDAQGIILVTPDGGVEKAPVLTGKLAALFDARVMQWAELAWTVSQTYSLPAGLLVSMIFRESGGNAAARNSETPPGLGLCQITNTSLYQGLTQAQVLEPLRNLSIAARYLHWLASHCTGAGLPELASMYNAGAIPGPGPGNTLRPHPSAVSPWGYRETAGHIGAEVAASNYYLGKTAGIAADVDPVDDEKALSLVALTAWSEIGDLLADHVHGPETAA